MVTVGDLLRLMVNILPTTCCRWILDTRYWILDTGLRKRDWWGVIEIDGEYTAYHLLPLDTGYWNGKTRLIVIDGDLLRLMKI